MDGVALLAATHLVLSDMLDAAAKEDVVSSSEVGRLILALEMRCKLEELVLYPAIVEALRQEPGLYAALEAGIARLRDASDRLVAATVPERSEHLQALRDQVSAHLVAVAAMVARPEVGRRIDTHRLGQDMQGLMKRWQQEIAQTGGIEDEERDPVGLPPR